MEQDHITFKVSIEQCCNSSWQGKLTVEGRTIEFKSELELLIAMDRMIQGMKNEVAGVDTNLNDKKVLDL